jgi:hypothetical protein
MLSGCSTTSGSDRYPSPTPEPTPPPDVNILTEAKPLPTPDAVSDETAARSFVETHERRYVYNELVDGFGTTQPATDITVESTDAAVVYTSATNRRRFP